jgi:hypothetical protein
LGRGIAFDLIQHVNKEKLYKDKFNLVEKDDEISHDQGYQREKDNYVGYAKANTHRNQLPKQLLKTSTASSITYYSLR